MRHCAAGRGGDTLDKRQVAYISMGFGLLVLVFLLLLAWGGRRQTSEIVLPENQTDSASPGEDPAGVPLNTVTIDPETVASAVGVLDRPSSYSRSQVVETFWSGGSGRAVSQVHVNGPRTRLDTTLPDGSVRHMLVAEAAGPDGQTLAGIWYDDETKWTRLESGALTADMAGRMLTYETVQDLAAEEIAQADYRSAFDADCIYVETRQDEAGYVDRYWVNVRSGLLIAAERLSYGTLVYRFSAGEPELPSQEEDLFLLPDGAVLGG